MLADGSRQKPDRSIAARASGRVPPIEWTLERSECSAWDVVVA
jgi:hypothetical protein